MTYSKERGTICLCHKALNRGPACTALEFIFGAGHGHIQIWFWKWWFLWNKIKEFPKSAKRSKGSSDFMNKNQNFRIKFALPRPPMSTLIIYLLGGYGRHNRGGYWWLVTAKNYHLHLSFIISRSHHGYIRWNICIQKLHQSTLCTSWHVVGSVVDALPNRAGTVTSKFNYGVLIFIHKIWTSLRALRKFFNLLL